MRQSTIIFGVLILAFIVYITMRGQLPAYLALFSSSKSASSTSNTASNTPSTASKSGIDWAGLEAGDWGALADLTKNALPKLGF